MSHAVMLFKVWCWRCGARRLPGWPGADCPTCGHHTVVTQRRHVGQFGRTYQEREQKAVAHGQQATGGGAATVVILDPRQGVVPVGRISNPLPNLGLAAD